MSLKFFSPLVCDFFSGTDVAKTSSIVSHELWHVDIFFYYGRFQYTRADFRNSMTVFAENKGKIWLMGFTKMFKMSMKSTIEKKNAILNHLLNPWVKIFSSFLSTKVFPPMYWKHTPKKNWENFLKPMNNFWNCRL